jgi:hypothetical protein
MTSFTHKNFDFIVTFLDGQTHFVSLQGNVDNKVINKVGVNYTNGEFKKVIKYCKSIW